MSIKEFFRPTKKKIIIFIIILIVGLLSNGLRFGAFGRPLTSTEKFLNTIPSVTSPGINALMRDNGFFINFKPYGTFDMILEGIVHIGIDVFYWYLLAGIIIFLVSKIKSKKQIS